MIIRTVRPEEARVHDTYAGYHQFRSEPTATDYVGDPPTETYGSFEIFWHDGAGEPGSARSDDEEDFEPQPAGWYWRAYFPGCVPDGEPSGPFASSRQALQDADEWHPEFDE